MSPSIYQLTEYLIIPLLKSYCFPIWFFPICINIERMSINKQQQAGFTFGIILSFRSIKSNMTGLSANLFIHANKDFVKPTFM